MGVQGLVKFITEMFEEDDISLEQTLMDLKRRGIHVVGIDTYIYLYMFLGNAEKMAQKIMKMCMIFLNHGILPFFVIDGRFDHENSRDEVKLMYEMKRNTVGKRKSNKKRFRMEYRVYEYILEIKKNSLTFEQFFTQVNEFIRSNEYHEHIRIPIENFYTMSCDDIRSKMNSIEKKTWYIGQEHLDMCRMLLDFVKVPYAFSYYEADALLAELCKRNVIQAVLTDDSDLLAYGTPMLLRNLNFDTCTVSVFEMDTILKKMNITYEMFVDMSILFGTDYNNRIKKLKPNDSYDMIVKHCNIENIFDEIFTKEGKNIPRDFHYEEVRKIYYQKHTNEEIQRIQNILGYCNIHHKIQNTRIGLENTFRKVDMSSMFHFYEMNPVEN
jgi:5'-3' exonuclease